MDLRLCRCCTTVGTVASLWVLIIGNNRKLDTISGDLVIVDSYELRNLTLPALSTVDGGLLLDGHFDQYVLLFAAWLTSQICI